MNTEVNSISQQLRQIVKNHVGKSFANTNTCDAVKSEIYDYLEDVQKAMNYPNLPIIKVDYEGSILTVNFFTAKNERLDTLGDLILYMAGHTV